MRNRAGRAATAASVLVVPRGEDPLEAASLKIPRECLHSSMIVTWPQMRLSTVDSLSCGPQPRQSSADANACVGVTSRQTAMRRDDTSTSLHPGYRLGSDRGSPNAASTLLSKRVMAQIRSPARVRTYTPVPCRMPVGYVGRCRPCRRHDQDPVRTARGLPLDQVHAGLVRWARCCPTSMGAASARRVRVPGMSTLRVLHAASGRVCGSVAAGVSCPW